MQPILRGGSTQRQEPSHERQRPSSFVTAITPSSAAVLYSGRAATDPSPHHHHVSGIPLQSELSWHGEKHCHKHVGAATSHRGCGNRVAEANWPRPLRSFAAAEWYTKSTLGENNSRGTVASWNSLASCSAREMGLAESRLLTAAKDNDLDKVKELLDKGVTADCSGKARPEQVEGCMRKRLQRSTPVLIRPRQMLTLGLGGWEPRCGAALSGRVPC